MVRQAPQPDDHAAMLRRHVLVIELRPHDPDRRVRHDRHHAVQPIRLQRRHVVVQQQHELPRSLRHPHIVGHRVVERPPLQHRDPRPPAPPQHLRRLRLRLIQRPLLRHHHQHLERRIRRPRQHILQARQLHRPPQPRRHDHIDPAPHPSQPLQPQRKTCRHRRRAPLAPAAPHPPPPSAPPPAPPPHRPADASAHARPGARHPPETKLPAVPPPPTSPVTASRSGSPIPRATACPSTSASDSAAA